MAAIRQVLAPLPREGIVLRRGTLLLETSYPYGESFYATAWMWERADLPLFFELARAGRLLVTWQERIIVCGHSLDAAQVEDMVADGEVVRADSPAQLGRTLGI